MQNSQQVDALVVALFKEYLMLSEFPETLNAFKAELLTKSFEQSITKRSQMIEMLHLKDEALAEQAKRQRGEPFIRSTLELLVSRFMAQVGKGDCQAVAQAPAPAPVPAPAAAAGPENAQKAQLKPYSGEKIEIRKKIVKKVVRAAPAQSAQSVQSAQLPLAKSLQQAPKQAEPAFDSIWSGTSISGKRSSLPQIKSGESSEILLPAFIEQTSSMQDFFLALFHDKRVKEIPDNWYQGLYNVKPNAPIDLADYGTWGIHQDKGGPCGFIAVIQARAVKHIFFGEKTLFQGQNVYRNAVLQALHDTFRLLAQDVWYFALPKTFYAGIASCDFLIKEMASYMVVSVTNLQEFLDSSSFKDYCFCDQVCSFIPSMVVSMVLTRGVTRILTDDFDAESGNSLFSNYNNASQELVNLILTGRATAGLHNEILDVGGMKLKGVFAPVDVGVVTIFEFHQYMKVGSFLRQDIQFPIYVCFNEAHFTVLFALNRRFVEVSQRERGTVEMVYIDQLSDQTDMYTLNVQFDVDAYERRECESFVENLLQTLLPVTAVDWKGKEKLL